MAAGLKETKFWYVDDQAHKVELDKQLMELLFKYNSIDILK